MVLLEYKNSQKFEFSQIFGSDHVLEPCMEFVFQRFLEKSLERIFLLARIPRSQKSTRITRILVIFRLEDSPETTPHQKCLVKSKVGILYKVPVQYEADPTPHRDARARYVALADSASLRLPPELLPI